jgi:IS30 family transposase
MARKKTGRPPKDIDWNQLDKLCALHCTAVECASFLDMSIDTLERHIKERYSLSFPEYFRQKAASGKISLRRKQFEMAMSNPTMAIWIGKQWLGQTDKQEVQSTVNSTQEIKITQSEIIDLIKQTMKRE